MQDQHFNARILVPGSDEELAREFQALGVEPGPALRWARKSRFYILKLDRLNPQLAGILLDAADSGGAQALIGRVATGVGAAVLLGTEEQIERVLAEVAEAPGQGTALADEIRRAIERYRTGPEMPPPEILPDPRARRLFDEMSRRTLVMGILNVTPDSFSDGGVFLDEDAAAARGIEMAEQGADIIDVGGESTRPGAEPVPPEEEIRRTAPVIERLSTAGLAVSIDTYHAATVRAALDAGAVMVNDISGCSFDENMRVLAAERKVPAVLMHIKGTPRDMQKDPTYADLMGEICAFLRERLADAVEAGIDERLLIIDPGFGFGKKVEHNLELLRRLRELTSLGRPILAGTSRKSTIGHVLGGLPPEERLEGTAATVALSIANGANIVRVHDVREMARVAKMTDAVVRG